MTTSVSSRMYNLTSVMTIWVAIQWTLTEVTPPILHRHSQIHFRLMTPPWVKRQMRQVLQAHARAHRALAVVVRHQLHHQCLHARLRGRLVMGQEFRRGLG